MRNGLSRVLRGATRTLRLGWVARNSRRSAHRWEAPAYWDCDEASLDVGFRERVVGPSFVRNGQRFCLELYPGGFRDDARDQVGAYLRYEGKAKCVELRFRISVVNQLGGPDVAWRSAFMLLGQRSTPAEKIYTNWGTAQLCRRSWLRRVQGVANAGRGLVVDGRVRLRVDVMYVGEREMVANPTLRMASLDDADRGSTDRLIASGAARRDFDDDKGRARGGGDNPLAAFDEETKEPPEEEDEDDDEARAVTYKFHRAASGDVQQELLIDFEFA